MDGLYFGIQTLNACISKYLLPQCSQPARYTVYNKHIFLEIKFGKHNLSAYKDLVFSLMWKDCIHHFSSEQLSTEYKLVTDYRAIPKRSSYG